MTREEIQDRLEDAHPLRQGEFSLMTGYTPYTLRTAIKRGAIKAVSLPGTKEPRIAVDEAKRILAGLGVLSGAGGNGKGATSATSATPGRKVLRVVRA